jgi:predicted Zn-dependent protease
MKGFKLFSVALVAVFIASCATVPLTGRKQFNVVNEAEIQQQAAQAYAQFLSENRSKVVSGTADANRVRTIGSNIANAVSRFMQTNGNSADLSGYNWEFVLIQSNEANAWCMPGGKVAVYTGILKYTQNDAGLATVLGHEIAHAIARHASERASQSSLAQLGGAVIGGATGSNTLSQLYGLGGSLALLKYGRNQELEADRLGLTFMAMAGYNPESAIAFWQRMAAAKDGQAPPEFMSTHPDDGRRIQDIQKYLPEAQQYYKR